MSLPTIRVATAHISPALLSKQLCTDKTISYIKLAARNGARLVAFPESSIPGFPIWASLLPPAHPATHAFFHRFAQESVQIDQEEIQAIREVARQQKINVSLGISEKAGNSLATLWNSNLLISEKGQIASHHRKLACTWFEKLVWSHGDGHGLRPMVMEHDRRVRVGALICGENTNPLARYAMTDLGVNIHISTWPSIWPSRIPTKSNVSATGKNYDNILANRIRTAAMCFEAKCFGIMCAAQFSQENLKIVKSILDPADTHSQEIFDDVLQNASHAPSMILDPTGTPVYSWTLGENGEKQIVDMLQKEEELLYADLDLNSCVEGKQYHDLLGAYQRADVFTLHVNRKRSAPVRYGIQLEKDSDRRTIDTSNTQFKNRDVEELFSVRQIERDSVPS